MLVQILLLLLGLVLLVKGAEWLVSGASSLAKKHNISDLAIGLTIVAFGTSAPELVVNTIASFQSHSDIVFGNVIGSNIFNTFLILGVVGLIAPLAVQSSTVWKEIPWSFVAIIMLFFLTNDFWASGDSMLGRGDGLILIAMFGFFLFFVSRQLKSDMPKPETDPKISSNLKIWALIIIGLSLLVIGGQLVVGQAISLATTLGVSEKIIGLTIVAAGTSLPELATSVVAAVKKNNDIAVGNIIGSNIFNILFILPVSSFVRPLVFNIQFNTDLYFLAGGTLLLFIAMFTGNRKKLDRWEAGVLMATFIFYTIYLVVKE